MRMKIFLIFRFHHSNAAITRTFERYRQHDWQRRKKIIRPRKVNATGNLSIGQRSITE
ncbi:hypothetical protein PSEUDO8O_60012 [Pseudomonas sp. 8O]|nr:hypothetical protein PSEUDO8O_60012 [Pseudomonas sp. 8O]